MRTVPPTEKGKYRAIASGAIANGKPVVVNSDGTVSQVSSTGTVTAASTGTHVEFENAQITSHGLAYSTEHDRVAIAYRDHGNSNYGTVVVGTISGTSISYGTPTVYRSNSVTVGSTVYASDQSRIAIVYNNSNINRAETAIGLIDPSDNSIAIQYESDWYTGTIAYITTAFNDTQNFVTAAFMQTSDSDGYVRGFDVASNGQFVESTSNTKYEDSTIRSARQKIFYAKDVDGTNDRIVVAYADDGDSDNGKVTAGYQSGTSDYAFNLTATFNAAATGDVGAAYIGSGKFVVAYRDGGNSNHGYARVGTFNSTSEITFGTAAVFNAAATADIEVLYDSSRDKIFILYGDAGNNEYATIITGTVSGTDISFSDETALNSVASIGIYGVVDPDTNNIVVCYQNNGDSGHGYALVHSPATSSTNLTSTENYIGIAKGGSYADGQSMTVDIIGTVNDDQTSLTAGQQYFVQTDGTLSTSAGSPSVFAGTAISATELIVKE